jgi:hypothetical protein
VSVVRIGAGAGFAGDRSDAALPVVAALARADGPRFLIYETLAERTLALSQLERQRNRAAGYNPGLDRFLQPVLRQCVDSGIRIVGNFGAANPRAAAFRILQLAEELHCRVRVGIVEGDDLSGMLSAEDFAGREIDGNLLRANPQVISANVYLGAEPIAQALALGADVVVTGRVADSALALGPLLHAFHWSLDDWDRLAAGTLAGHLLECGAQVTGGYFADPGVKDVPGLAEVGYPILEIDGDGSFVVTKPAGTGGRIDRLTVTEQTLYEIHDPAAYLAPDVILDISDVTIEEIGPDRVRVRGARGKPRPQTLKATVCIDGGVLGEAEISYAGLNAAARARLAADIIRKRLSRCAPDLKIRVDAIGLVSILGDSAGTVLDSAWTQSGEDIRLRFAAQAKDAASVEVLLDEVEALYCAGPAGGAGVRRRLVPRLASASCLIERSLVVPTASLVEHGA